MDICDSAFSEFGSPDDGQILLSYQALLPALHRCGLNPSYAAIDALPRKSMPACGRGFSQSEFRSIACDLEPTRASYENLTDLLHTFDVGHTGSIALDELALLLRGDGEPLDEDEVEALLSMLKPDLNGGVTIHALAELLAFGAPIPAPVDLPNHVERSAPGAVAPPQGETQMKADAKKGCCVVS